MPEKLETEDAEEEAATDEKPIETTESTEQETVPAEAGTAQGKLETTTPSAVGSCGDTQVTESSSGEAQGSLFVFFGECCYHCL